MKIQKILLDFEQHLSQKTDETLFKTTLQQLADALQDVPFSGSGQTYARWQILAEIAATHLGLAKCIESHLDALGILKELGITDLPKGLYAIWAAEGAGCDLTYDNGICNGHKAWCSAAQQVDYALMTYKNAQNQSCLVLVDVANQDITIDLSHWHAVGMHSTQTAQLYFQNVPARQVGKPNAYLERVGFWHGAAGVAACWYGATTRLAQTLLSAVQQRNTSFHTAYLGQISTLMVTTQHLFHRTAEAIDQAPQHSHEYLIRILRAQVEQTAQQTLMLVGQALGARPFCQDAVFAQLAADLPVFLRQSHAAFDFEKIGELTTQRVGQQESPLWQL